MYFVQKCSAACEELMISWWQHLWESLKQLWGIKRIGWEGTLFSYICDRIWEKGALRANPEFWF